MEARKTSWRRKTCLTVSMATILALGVAFSFWLAPMMLAQTPGTPGVISGSVTADRGVVRAFRVKAKDTVHGIAYTVFTNKGRYQIFNLPPSTYEVQVLEEGFDAPVQTTDVKPGETKTVNLALKAKAATAEELELVDFDTLYPPSPARDVLLKSCFPCHSAAGYQGFSKGQSGWHARRMTEAGWRVAVDNMFTPGKIDKVGRPVLTYDMVSAEQKEGIIKYLASNFGPNSKLRDLKTDTLVRDEDALTETIFVQYELPPVQSMDFSDGKPSRGVHDVFPGQQPDTRGIVWLTGTGSDSILSVDTRHPDYSIERRSKEFRIPNPANINVTPHGIIESKGHVYWTELRGDRIGELNPKTGEIRRYSPPTDGGGGHTLRADSKGNIWYTNFAGVSKIGRLDAATKKITELEPVKGWNGYGIVVDRKDRVWASGPSTPAVVMYDPKTEKWTSYPTSSPTRRPTVDSKGKIWACQFFGNAIVKIDPDTGQVTEYKLPLKYGNPYEVWADLEDNLWVDNRVYNSLVKFDQQTKKFTYVPYPDLRGHTPKVEVDSQGTIWFALGRPSQLTAFKSKGNVLRKSSASQ